MQGNRNRGVVAGSRRRTGPRASLAASLLVLAAQAASAAGFPAQETPAAQAEADSAAEARHRLETIEVTVSRSPQALSRLPYAASVVTSEELRRGQRTASMEEGLRGVPGVFVQNRRNFALGDRLTIRGVGSRAQFGVRGIQILADGIPLTLPDGQATLTNLDLSSAGRVEVIRGPVSALHGNAAGGVLSYRTEDFSARPVVVSPDVAGGSHGFLHTRFQASGTLGRFAYLANFRRLEMDGFREYGRAETYAGNVVLRQELSPRTELRGVLNVFHMPFGENASSITREDARENPEFVRPFIIGQGAGEENTQGQAGVSLTHRFGGERELHLSGWGLQRSIWNPIPGRIIDLDRDAAGLRPVLRGAEPLGPGRAVRWVVGADAGLQSDSRVEFENEGVAESGGRAREGALLLDQRERVMVLGPFAEGTFDLTEALRLTVAGRFDAYNFDVADRRLEDGDDSGGRDLTHFSPMVGLTFAPREAFALFGNFATAFNTPTTVELSNRPDGSGGFNEQLEPEVIESFELGVRGWVQPARLRYGATAYFATVNDALIPFQGPTEEVFFRNAGKVSRDGLEVELAWLPHPRVETRVAYAFQDYVLDEFATQDADFSGNEEPGVPRNRVFAGVTWWTPFGLRSAVDVQWVDAFFVNDANTFTNWSYRVVNLRFDADVKVGGASLRPYVGIDNVFDERYNGSVVPNAFGDRFYEPAPGVAAYGGLQVPVGSR